MPILQSLLDTDLYKLTMQKAVLRKYAGVPVQYRFTNRNNTLYPETAHRRLREEIDSMTDLRLCGDELDFLRQACPFLDDGYLSYLNQYRYDPGEVRTGVIDGQLELEVRGAWERTILWEVPLLALVSECFYPSLDEATVMAQQVESLHGKARLLSEAGCFWADFGTRRRRCYRLQEECVRVMKAYHGFRGTSNVHLAHVSGVKPMGTMAHEWIMGVSALESLSHANRYALRAWSDVFNGDLGIALPDTFGTDIFWRDFDPYLSRLFDGVRHDSGSPYTFGDAAVEHYRRLRIDPTTKWVIFTDGLNPEKAVEIYRYFKGRIGASFGIGTNFTNDVPGSQALNIVIKLVECNGAPVVKLSDAPTKATGDRDALRVAKWTFFKEPLDPPT